MPRAELADFLRLGTDANSGTEVFGPVATARLRAASARYPDDEQLRRLQAELFARSDEFRGLRGAHPVHAPGRRSKVLAHPELGRLRVNCDVLPTEEDDQQLVLVTGVPGSPAAEVLTELTERNGP